MIDPKPYTGDACYDATQHLLNCRGRLAANPDETISTFANLLGVDEHRVRAWTFARLAVGGWELGVWRLGVGGWGDDFDQTQQLAHLIPPT